MSILILQGNTWVCCTQSGFLSSWLLRNTIYLDERFVKFYTLQLQITLKRMKTLRWAVSPALPITHSLWNIRYCLPRRFFVQLSSLTFVKRLKWSPGSRRTSIKLISFLTSSIIRCPLHIRKPCADFFFFFNQRFLQCLPPAVICWMALRGACPIYCT